MHVHFSGSHAGNGAAHVAYIKAGSIPQPGANTGQTASPSNGSRPVDQVDLSPTAQAMLDTTAGTSGPGKSALSPAHRAWALIEAQPELANMPFGQVVSGLIHGTLPAPATSTATSSDQTVSAVDGQPPADTAGSTSANTDATASSGSDGAYTGIAGSTETSASTDTAAASGTNDGGIGVAGPASTDANATSGTATDGIAPPTDSIDPTASTDGTDAATAIANAIPTVSTTDTESMLLNALSDTSQNNTSSSSVTA